MSFIFSMINFSPSIVIFQIILRQPAAVILVYARWLRLMVFPV
jgi:hypothetical protein